MKRFLLFLIAPLFFFLSINIQPVSAVTCYTNIFDPSTAYEVQRTCTSNSDCADNEKCALFGGCGGWLMGWVFSPCKPLDCAGCSVPINHQCVSQPRPSSTPNCCSYVCIEGCPGYSASLFDQTCYSLTNIQTDVNNCGYCGNKCATGQTCESGKCIIRGTSLTACPDGTLENACCTTPGTRCKNDGTGTLACQNDATCPFCTDTDGGKVPGTKGTC